MKLTKENFITNLRNNKRWHILLLVILPAIIYTQAIKFDYTNFDDNGIIKDKYEIVGNIKKIDTLMHVDAFFNATGDFYRPVQNYTFMQDALLQQWGTKSYEHFKVKILKEKDADNYFSETDDQRRQNSLDTLWMFHITNLLIHVLTCIALYFFLQLFKLKSYTAFLLSVLFAVHPLFASGVGWIPSRGDILIGLLGLLLFITFDKYFKGKKVLWFILHSLIFLVIIYTKETTILFPVLLLYYYFLLIHQPSDFKFKTDLLKLLPFFILWLAVCGSYLYMRSPVTKNTGATIDVLGIIPFFKNNTVIPTIIGKFFIPYRLSPFPLYEDVSTIIGLVFLLGLLYLTFEYTKTKKWGVLLGMLWFILFAVPPTLYRLPNADIFFNYLEHRTYLPMIGIVLILGFFLEDEFANNISFTKFFNWLYVPVILLFGILAYLHCSDYQNPSTLRNRAAALDNPAALAGQAGDLLNQKDTTAALADINKAIELNPTDAGMYFEKGNIMSRMQQHAIAEQNFSLALQIEPSAADALLARSVERRFLKKYQSAYRDIFQAQMLDSTNPRVYYSYGNLFIATQNYPDAITSFSKCISLQPMYAEAYNNRAYAKILSGNYTGAVVDCHIASTMIPRNYIVYNNLGHAFRELNQPDSALFYVNKGISLNNNFAEGYFERGMEEQKNKDITNACKDWSQAATLGYTDTTGIINKYCSASYYK
jgi:tetratricopeptide (TPR) repeat protein